MPFIKILSCLAGPKSKCQIAHFELKHIENRGSIGRED